MLGGTWESKCVWLETSWEGGVEVSRTWGGGQFQEGKGKREVQEGCCTRGRRAVLGQGREEGGHGR